MTEISIDATDVIRKITLDVKLRGANAASIRIKLASLVFRFGAWVGGFGGVTMDVEGK